MKKIFLGLEGAGKDLHFSRLIWECAERNVYWKNKYGFTRAIATSQPLSEEFKKWIESQGIPVIEIRTQSEIAKLSGCDLFIPELAPFFDARGWENMPHSLRVWLSQQSKRGVHFYGASQNFEQIDVAFRRLVPKGNTFEIIKIFGSPRPGLNLPPVKKVWGLYTVVEMIYTNEQEKKRIWFPIPKFYWIKKKYTSLFDTNKITPIEYTPFEHFERTCENKNCSFVKVIHK